MFVILYYDVDKKRCVKMLKKCRQYLQWVQNSVFEGEISEGNFEILLNDIKSIIKKKEEESIVIYKFRTMQYSKRIVIGTDKKDDINFL